MNPIEIPDAEVPAGYQRVRWAEGQDEYNTLPAIVGESSDGIETRHRWTFSEDERRAIAEGADIDVTALTFGGRLQPIKLHVLATPLPF